MNDHPRWIDLIYGVLIAALVVACVFLVLENQERRHEERVERRRLEKLKDWHIHVSSELNARGLDVEPVLTSETLEDE